VSTDLKPLYDLCLVGCFDTASVVNEDPLLVPLVYFSFWVQVHSLPPKLFSKTVAQQLDISDSDMGWDLTLKAVGRRANVVDSVWLWKGFEGGPLGSAPSDSTPSDGIHPHLVAKSTRMLHPILGFRLEGVVLRFQDIFMGGVDGILMVRDTEDIPLMGIDGKKLQGRSTNNHETSMMECSWVGELTGCATARAKRFKEAISALVERVWEKATTGFVNHVLDGSTSDIYNLL
ncbi:hypothetical protein Golax_018236, partial [Gossypium laxum]|nr:hypothetical protein [Gossypium laxum]